MKTELEKRLNKLPAYIDVDNICYQFKLQKDNETNHWFVEYTDNNDNSIIIIEHQSLQAAVDTTLREIKQYINKEDEVVEFLKKHTGYKLNK